MARKAPSPLELAILRAVTYAALFDYPITPAEARRTLTGMRCSEVALMACYRTSAYLQARLGYHRGHFVPLGREGLVEERVRRRDASLAVIDAHRRVLDIVAAMPFVRLAAVSGSLAHLNAGASADVDLFVVTTPGAVWSVTLGLVVAAKVLGRRRSTCVNYVVDETALAVPQRDEFTANQLIHLRPVAGGAPALAAVLDANPFAREVYPNFDPREMPAWPFTPSAWTRRWQARIERWCAWPLRVWEPVVRTVYGAYLRRRMRRWPSPEGVTLSAHVVKLHGYSHRGAIARGFAEALARADATTRAGASPGSN